MDFFFFSFQQTYSHFGNICAVCASNLPKVLMTVIQNSDNRYFTGFAIIFSSAVKHTMAQFPFLNESATWFIHYSIIISYRVCIFSLILSHESQREHFNHQFEILFCFLISFPRVKQILG